MALIVWLAGHWFDVLQTTSILVGLFVTTHTVRTDIKERKIQNLFTLTAAHRELWTQFYERADLQRILEAAVDLTNAPLTTAESRFVHLLILHLRASFKARTFGMQFDDDAFVADIRQFFRRPIPSVVWKRTKVFQDRDFVSYVDSILEKRGD